MKYVRNEYTTDTERFSPDDKFFLRFAVSSLHLPVQWDRAYNSILHAIYNRSNLSYWTAHILYVRTVISHYLLHFVVYSKVKFNCKG